MTINADVTHTAQIDITCPATANPLPGVPRIIIRVAFRLWTIPTIPSGNESMGIVTSRTLNSPQMKLLTRPGTSVGVGWVLCCAGAPGASIQISPFQ